MNRTIECFVGVQFHGTLSNPDFDIDGVPGYGQCLDQNGLDVVEHNNCMANETILVLAQESDDKNWAVVVYHFEDKTYIDDDDDDDDVVWRCQDDCSFLVASM